MSLRFFWYRISRELEKYDYTILNDVFTFYYHGKLYTLDVGSSYPFRAPELIMSNDNIISYNPRLYPSRLWMEYKKQTNKCMCCDNMLCANNWSPARGIIHVIQEYEEFIETLKTMQKKRMAQYMHLPDDIIRYICEFL